MKSKKKSDGMRCYVYALCEPDTGEVRYIGLSANVWKRLLNHFRGASVPKVRDWVTGLRKQGLIPSVRILRRINGLERGIDAEREEIRKHASPRLLNTDGVPGRNRHRPTNLLTLNGKSMIAADWARELGISRQALNARLQKHPIEIALGSGNRKGSSLDGKREHLKVELGEEVFLVEGSSVGFTHAERKARRRYMAQAVFSGELVASVAGRFGVTMTTVNAAVKEFQGQLLVAKAAS